MIYKTLREANDARHVEWDKDDAGTHSFYGNELAGEMGELFDAAYIYGSNQQAIADELADTVICIDLVARRFGIEIGIPHTKRSKSPMADQVSFVQGICLASAVGRACNVVKKLEREMLGMVGSRGSVAELATYLNDAVFYLAGMARSFDISLPKAVAVKFNKTSAKYGLATMMEVPA